MWSLFVRHETVVVLSHLIDVCPNAYKAHGCMDAWQSNARMPRAGKTSKKTGRWEVSPHLSLGAQNFEDLATFRHDRVPFPLAYAMMTRSDDGGFLELVRNQHILKFSKKKHKKEIFLTATPTQLFVILKDSITALPFGSYNPLASLRRLEDHQVFANEKLLNEAKRDDANLMDLLSVTGTRRDEDRLEHFNTHAVRNHKELLLFRCDGGIPFIPMENCKPFNARQCDGNIRADAMAECVFKELHEQPNRELQRRIHVHCFKMLPECKVIVPLTEIHGRPGGIVYFPEDTTFETRLDDVVVYVDAPTADNPPQNFQQMVIIHYHTQCVSVPKLTAAQMVEQYGRISRRGGVTR